jgi:ABC-type transporter Mla subunit MlaD
MSARANNFKIGVFVILGACLFIGALFAMGLKSYFGKRVVFETYVTGKVENLSVGALVKFRGVTIGKVSAIRFAGTEYPEAGTHYVVIEFEVPQDFDWGVSGGDLQQMLDGEAARGLRARVQGQGFLGANIVAIEYVDPGQYPAEPLAWKPKHYYIPSAPNQINHLLTSLETTLRKSESLDLADLQARVRKLLDSVNRLADNINQIDFKNIGTNAGALVAELRDTNRGLQKTLTNAQETLTDARNAVNGADVPAISRQTLALEARISAAATEFRHVLASIDTGELNGSLANIRNATDELIVLLHDIEQRPSSVIFSKSPEPVSALEKPPKK